MTGRVCAHRDPDASCPDRRAAVNRLAPAALAGVLIGLGLGLWANVSGVVLAFYGLVLGTVLGMLVLSLRGGRH